MNSRTHFVLFTLGLMLVSILSFPAHITFADENTDASSTPDVTSTTTDPTIDLDASSTDPVIDIDNATSTATSTDSDAATTTDISSSSPTTTPSLPSPVTITLDIETATTTLFDGPITVSACEDSVGSGNFTVNGYCAIQQSGFAATWLWFPSGAALVSVGDSGDWNNGPWWTTFSNNTPLFDALNVHTLTAGENLLVTDGPTPLELSVSSTSPTVGSTTTLTLLGFNINNFDYEPLQGATIIGADASTTDANGQVVITATSTSPVTLSAKADGYLQSNSVIITGISAATSTATSTGSGGSGGSNSSTSINIPAAFAFLTSQQNANGSFVDDERTDWAALPLALSDAPSNTRATLANYLKTTTPSEPDVISDERHAMALMALGINPSSGTGVDYVSPIVSAFDGTKIGGSEDNNDIFGLIVLSKLGYSSTDSIVAKTVAYLVSTQNASGSWDSSVDLTGAAMQALSQYTSLPGVSAALSNAQSYLRSAQQGDGGFGNPDSTSWAINGLSAVGQSAASWTNAGGQTPLSSLAAAQEADGRINSGTGDTSADIWATEWSLVAAENRTWPSLLSSFAKPSIQGASGITSSSTATSTATTTLQVATSTPLVATSTGATTTPDVPLMPVPHSARPVPQIDSAFTDIPNYTATSSSSSNDLLASAGEAPAAQSIWNLILEFFNWLSSLFEKVI